MYDGACINTAEYSQSLFPYPWLFLGGGGGGGAVPHILFGWVGWGSSYIGLWGGGLHNWWVGGVFIIILFGREVEGPHILFGWGVGGPHILFGEGGWGSSYIVWWGGG